MRKLYAISADGSHVDALRAAWQSNFRTSLRHQWYKDTALNLSFIVFYPRNLDELLTIRSMPGLVVLPDLEDQMGKLSATAVAALPAAALVTQDHNTYQAAQRLFNHYQWRPFHPLD